MSVSSHTLEVAMVNRCFSVGLSLVALLPILWPTTSMKSCLQPPNVIKFLKEWDTSSFYTDRQIDRQTG